MADERRLSLRECDSAQRIQQAIDELAPRGGRLILPELALTLDRGLELRSDVELVGQGRGTVPARATGVAAFFFCVRAHYVTVR